MKRLYVALSLIFIAIFICVFSSIKVEESSLHMLGQLKEIGDTILSGDTEKAKKQLEETEKTWRKTETLFSFIVDADKIEEMNVGFSMITAHLNDSNEEHALERLRECELLLGEIITNEKLSIKNIM